MQSFTSHSEAETERIAARFAKTLHGGAVILLDGELGAGKTVFVRGLAEGLGVIDRVTSPTFVLMRVHDAHHRSIRHFVHVDAYRVRDAHGLEAIGLPEWISRPDVVVAVEWGERVEPLVGDVPHTHMRFLAPRRRPEYRTITMLVHNPYTDRP